jgi:membrane protein
MPEKTIIRRQASCCFFTCIVCLSLALLAAGTASRLVPADMWEASVGGGFLLQVAAVVLYAVTRRRKRIFRIVGIFLNTLGVGLIMAAHPLAADFRLTAQTLSLCAVPAAVLLAAYLSVLLFPRARKWCGVGCMACLIALLVLFAVLWSKRGVALYGFPLYSTVFVFFYAVTLVPEADDLKTIGDTLFFSSLGALIVILFIVLAAVSQGDCCDADCCDCCDCGGTGDTKRTKIGKRK